MSEHFTELRVERYRLRQMSPAELLAAGDHLAVCEACRLKTVATVRAEAMFNSLKNNLVASGAEAAHLSYEQIAALVDDQITGAAREIIEAHINLCAPCAEEVKDLSAFKSMLATAAADQPPRAAAPTTIDRFAAFKPWLTTWTLPRFAAAAIVLLAGAAAIMLFVWKPTDLNQTELAQRSPTPPIVQPSSSVASDLPRPPGDATPDSAAPVRPDDSTPTPPPATDSLAEVVIALNDDGGRITLDRNGNVTGLDGLSPSSRQAVRTALTTGAVNTPRGLAELARGAGTLMGSSAEGVAFPPVNPVGVIVRTDRPTLRWQPLSGVTSYTVTLLDSRTNAVATSPPLTATAWTVPRPLTRGDTYTWQVTAVKDGREVISPAAPAPEARFKVLEQSKVGELERMERAKVNSRLTRGVLYAEAGLLIDAEREFTALLKTNPRSRVAQKLLRSAQAARRLKAKLKGK